MNPAPSTLDSRALEAQVLGVLGGTFDPVHEGHLHVARAAVRALELEHVVFVPARRSPHKVSTAEASGADRLEMLRLALQSDDLLSDRSSTWDFELNARGPS